MESRLSHHMEGNLFRNAVVSDFIDDALGQVGIHMPEGSFHLGLGAKGAVKIAYVGKLEMHSFEGNRNMTEAPFIPNSF